MKGIAGALLRYRVMALVTGTVLLFNCLVAVPVQIAGHPGLGAVTWTVHGGLFIVYCLTVIDLGIRASWSLLRIVLVAATGAIPVVTFVAEHFVRREMSASLAAGASNTA